MRVRARRGQSWLWPVVAAEAVSILTAITLAQSPDCRVVPLPGHRASFSHRGEERVGWHFGAQYPRPFFYPFQGPDGIPLTRMGHPGAPNHDHHRSIWFAHADVAGNNFWADQTEARIRQKQWLVYDDGETEAVMAVSLGWYDGTGRELMQQEVVAALRADSKLGPQLEIQSTFVPVEESLELGKTNFGFLAVRVAKHLSGHFGSGVISDSEGRRGEKEIFGKRARWMAYSIDPKGSSTAKHGLVYFDHPSNPRYPTHWHVREDGWMGASFGMKEAYTIKREEPLRLRYLLLASNEMGNRKAYDLVADEFAGRGSFEVAKSTRPHRQFEVHRKGAAEPTKQPEKR